jgi:hypothetical protein
VLKNGVNKSHHLLNLRMGKQTTTSKNFIEEACPTGAGDEKEAEVSGRPPKIVLSLS